MRSVIARYLILLNIFIFIAVSDISDYGIFDDAEPEGSIMADSSDLYASDALSSGVVSMDPAKDDQNPAFLMSATNDCSSDISDIPLIGKIRRGDVCQGNEGYVNERPFVLPSTLLDAVTIKAENYCPTENFNEGSQYLVCSSGFSMDMQNYGLAYQALLNGELGRYLFACAASVTRLSINVIYLPGKD